MSFVRPLAEVAAIVEANARLRRALGRNRLWELCAACPAPQCRPHTSACRAHEVNLARRRDHYRRHAPEQRAAARRYYYANYEAARAKSRAYQRDPVALATMAAKRRQRYAEKAAAAGRTVRPYQWKNPTKNQGRRHDAP